METGGDGRAAGAARPRVGGLEMVGKAVDYFAGVASLVSSSLRRRRCTADKHEPIVSILLYVPA